MYMNFERLIFSSVIFAILQRTNLDELEEVKFRFSEKLLLMKIRFKYVDQFHKFFKKRN